MNQESWNKYIIVNSSPSSFLQSWQWGEFQAALENKVERIELPNLQTQVIVRKLPLGRTYLEIPKGPIGEESRIKNQELWNELREKIQEIGKKENVVFVRVNPPYDIELPSRFRKPRVLLRQMEPGRTILVDLTKSEDVLLANMHEKSRYNIRLAERKGVKVRKATADEAAFKKFLELLRETSKRDGIVSWPDERFWKFRAIFMSGNPSPDIPRAELLVGEHGGRILAAAIIMIFGDAGTYLYAASSGEDRTSNAPSLVLWEAIREVKRQGSRWYDMWGVSPADDPNHSWAGITRFKSRYVKLGVTGKEIRSVGTRDLILNKPYYAGFGIAKRALDLFRIKH